MSIQKQFKLNVPLRGFKIGRILNLTCDDDGIPVDLYWFRRFHEAKKDNCIVAIEEEKQIKSKAKGDKNELI